MRVSVGWHACSSLVVAMCICRIKLPQLIQQLEFRFVIDVDTYRVLSSGALFTFQVRHSRCVQYKLKYNIIYCILYIYIYNVIF